MASVREVPIVETTSIRDVAKYAVKKGWNLFDLDDNIWEPQKKFHGLGGDAWFNALMTYGKSVQLDSPDAIANVLAVYNEVQFFVKMKPIESCTKKMISDLQAADTRNMAITSRSYHIAMPTLENLERVKIDFSIGWSKEAVFLQPELKDNSAVFMQGVLFCNGQPKGKCFNLLLDHLKKQPKKITMSDDRRDHLENVFAVANERKIEFQGIHNRIQDPKKTKKDFVKDFSEANRQIPTLFKQFRIPAQSAAIGLKLVTVEAVSLAPEMKRN